MVSPLPWRTRILNWAEDEGEEEDDWADDIVVVHVEWKQNPAIFCFHSNILLLPLEYPSAIFEVAAACRRMVAARIGCGRQPMHCCGGVGSRNFHGVAWRCVGRPWEAREGPVDYPHLRQRFVSDQCGGKVVL